MLSSLGVEVERQMKLLKHLGTEVAAENPLLLEHEIIFFSELIKPEQANFQTVIDNYTKAMYFYPVLWL